MSEEKKQENIADGGRAEIPRPAPPPKKAAENAAAKVAVRDKSDDPADKPVQPPRPVPAPKPHQTPPKSGQQLSEPVQSPAGAADPGSDADAAEPEGRAGLSSFVLFAAMPSWAISLFLHVFIILLLALFYLPAISEFTTDLTIGTSDALDTELTNLAENSAELDVSAESSDISVVDAPEIITDDPALVDDPLDTEAAAMSVELSDIGFEASASTDLMQEIGEFTGSGLDGRSAAERTRLVREAGGTEGSEQAVKRALDWLKRHQHPDGGWNFFHLGGRCSCTGHGRMAEARVGATAIALLPFLGSGNTHLSGNYKAEVQKGLYFLLNKQKASGSLWEDGGRMYSHGLASIVLCEAYAMTNDRALQKPAQAALNFIVYSQAPITGGWRYQPRDVSGGDTSVVGWQLMALKSGHMANLSFNSSVITRTKKFLDSVQANNGATYGYMAPGENRPSMNAVGLLCRMYLGWDHDHPPLIEGVNRLAKSRPSKVNMYFNYYATQVMRHYGGEQWEEWNKEMRDFLVKSQNRKGHADGSWLMGKDHTNQGGRLYCTAMATMILEVYYRHLPIYGKKASEVEFEL